MKRSRFGLVTAVSIGLLAGSAVGVAAQGATVTGTLVADECTRLLATDEDGNATFTPYYSERCVGTAEFDDLRLTGDYESTTTSIGDNDGMGFSEAAAGYEDIRITNAEGSWSGHEAFASIVTEHGEEVGTQPDATVLLGEGAYDGLAAVLTGDDTQSDLIVAIILEDDAVD